MALNHLAAGPWVVHRACLGWGRPLSTLLLLLLGKELLLLSLLCLQDLPLFGLLPLLLGRHRSFSSSSCSWPWPCCWLSCCCCCSWTSSSSILAAWWLLQRVLCLHLLLWGMRGLLINIHVATSLLLLLLLLHTA